MTFCVSVLGAFLFICIFNHVTGNGRLIEPRQRSSLWRNPEYLQNPAVNRNYEDDKLNCGGLWVSVWLFIYCLHIFVIVSLCIVLQEVIFLINVLCVQNAN